MSTLPAKNQEFITYQSNDGQISFSVNVFEETVWLTQRQMAELFYRNRVAITQHIGNIFKEGELEEKLVCKDFLHTTQHGAITGKSQEKPVKHYNLDCKFSFDLKLCFLVFILFKDFVGILFKEMFTTRNSSTSCA